MDNQVAIPQTPRKLVGLVAGRIVNYVMADGTTIRPLIIVNPGDATGAVSGVLLFDGVNDAHNHVQPLRAGASGFAPECATLVVDVPWAGWVLEQGSDLTTGEPCDIPLVANTWHFPPRQPVVAAGIDAAALETAMQPILTALIDTVNDKLAANLDHVNQMLDSHSALLVASRATAHDAAKCGEAVNAEAPECAGSGLYPPIAVGSLIGRRPGLGLYPLSLTTEQIEKANSAPTDVDATQATEPTAEAPAGA